MKKSRNSNNNSKVGHQANHNHGNSNGFLPNSLKFISSCIKTATSGVRSAGASVAASISADNQDSRDQVLWACFDRLELGPSSFRHVLLLGYFNGFQVLDVEDSSNVSELVSRRDDPVSFLQMQPLPSNCESHEGFRSSHPLLMVVACDEPKSSVMIQTGRDELENGLTDPPGNSNLSPTAVRFYSLRSCNYVHVLRFRSTVYMVRCSRQIVAVGLASQIYCFHAVTLENKFSVLTYPITQLGVGVNIGYGPMAVGPRWLTYASNNPLLSNTGRLSPQSLTPPGVSPSTSPSSGSLMARYAMESSKHLASGLLNLGDLGYKTFSKYYQELIPDGSSSPVSRVALHSTETESAGMVVVKEFVSGAVVSQFRAHTSPISALCFDPSGTLLVTASIHGNNINIFRIMPSRSRCGSGGTQSYEWTSSHVHLYKLHRGITSAVIQDICFSQYSQWIAIVSTKKTCHIYAMSPFGGDTSLQIQSSDVDGPTLSPVPSAPWWATPYFMANQQPFPPPAGVTLSVVSRIKDHTSGWLNTVSNAASSAAGKPSIPSGAVATVFHCALRHDLQGSQSNVALEHLLVYTPSGYVIQYKLLPSMVGDLGEAASRTGPDSSVQIQDEDLHVKVEPLQWWDVCRKNDWPEIEECISGTILGKQEGLDTPMDSSDFDDSGIGDKEVVKPLERSHLYLSNAEVQINSGRIPIWQKSKIYFHTMSSDGASEQTFTKDLTTGEMQVEKVPVQEIEIRRKDLLPVVHPFHRFQSDWSGRHLHGGGFSSSSSDFHESKEKVHEISRNLGDKLALNASVGHPDAGDSYPSILQPGNEHNGGTRGLSLLVSSALNQCFTNTNVLSISSKQPASGVSVGEDSNFSSSLSTLTSGSPSTDRTKEDKSVQSGRASEGSNISSNRSDLSMNMLDEGPIHESMDLEQIFQEGYCKASPLSNFRESAEVVTDVGSSSPCDREICEEDDDRDDMFGGVFAFSEEG